MPTTKTTEQKQQSSEKILSETELKDARNLLKVFLQAWKNYGLYPEGHATSTKSLESLMSAFADFFSKHGDLGLVVENERLLWGDSIIHEVPSGASAEDVVSLLYRDGIHWIEFQQGLPLKELSLFFNILKKYKSLQEETEGDIVTELIDSDMAYIKFKAADILWQDYPLLDFSSLNALTESGQDFSQIEPAGTGQQKSSGHTDSFGKSITGSSLSGALQEVSSASTSASESGEDASQISPAELEQLKSSEHTDTSAKSIADPSFNEALWEISSAEYEELQKMVLEEENWDNTEDVFDVLMAILRSQTDKYNFSSALDFTLEEVVDTIEQGEFGLLLRLFQSLQQLLYRDKPAEPSWIRPLIERFFQDLSQPEIFDLIGAKLLTLNDNDTEKIESLRQVLLYFPPGVILVLDPIILQTRSQEVQNMILEVTEHLCLKDMGPLEKILDHPDKELGEKLLAVLSRLKGERANKIFLKMVEHPSEKVRAQAVKILIAKDPKIVSQLFSHIDDPCEEVRKVILAGIARQKSTLVENLLLKYMKENFDEKEPEHILACYEALGGCGSVTALQFLKRLLLGQGWNRFTGFGKELHRQGAATALALMDTWETKDILLEASKSRYQVIRQAFQKAMAKIDALRGNNDGQRIQ
jgi:hypothetical protein